ncbi:MAG: FeoB-associated Cys-rich membrane protein [Clostridia bacterium]|nr:FeoB-associated Cys-rich membrane protein [Clostridia bacterium]
MDNIIIIAVLAIIIALAVIYIIRTKKSGKKCIGCPSGDCFSKKGGCSGNCSCCSSLNTKENN